MSGEMSGSSPLPDDVTMSTGTVPVFAPSRAQPRDARLRPSTMSALFVGPRLLADDAIAS